MNKNNLRKALSYDGIIKKYNKFYVPLPDRRATDLLNNPIMSNILSYSPEDLFNYNLLNIKQVMLNKATQKDDVQHNYDLFPEMYHKIDAEATKYKNNYYKQKIDKMTQTVRYVLKEFPTPYSSYAPSTPNNYNPSQTPSNKSSDDNDDDDDNSWFPKRSKMTSSKYFQRELKRMFNKSPRESPIPSPQPTPSDGPTPRYLTVEEIGRRSRSHSRSPPAAPSRNLSESQVRQRSRSRDDSSSSSSNSSWNRYMKKK